MISLEQHRESIALVIRAGQKAFGMRALGQLNVRYKTAEAYSAVTDADFAAHDILTQGFAKIFPYLEIISEEDERHQAFGEYGDAIILDPIDGTGKFIKGHSTFCVLAGFIKDKMPMHGIAYYPDPKVSKIFFTSAVNNHAYMQDVNIDESGFFTLGDAVQLGTNDRFGMPRVSEVFSDAKEIFDFDFETTIGRQPGGNLDMIMGDSEIVAGPHTMMDWDIAAFDAIARKSGAVFIDVNTRKPLTYGEARSEDRAFMVERYAGGNVDLLRRLNILKSVGNFDFSFPVQLSRLQF